MSTPLQIIARESPLSQRQVNEVMSLLPQIDYQVQLTSTLGDNNQQISLLDGNSPADFFTRELDSAIIQGKADIAIHSAKDLPFPLDNRLEIIALIAAEDTTDSLVSKNKITLANLPTGSIIGTSSPLRKKEILTIRPDLEIAGIRGCIEQRIAQVKEGKYDAAIIATCALKRLGLESEITEILPFKTNPLQGYLAVTSLKGKKNLKKMFAPIDILKNRGTVTLVGFGPGDPELLTIKAINALKNCDIIVHDDLLDKDYLNTFPAEKIYVGKRSGLHSFEQNDINEILLQHASKGKNVVRLKGGDPMIFAHGGEEIEYLQKNLISVSVIPGITTASALAASNKISLTQRNISSSVAFINGHSKQLDIPYAETLVFYMGASNLNTIAKKILNKGWARNTPVLLVHNVSLPNETCFELTLQEMKSTRRKYPTPLIALVGDVANLQKQEAKTIQRTLYTGSICENPSYIHTPLIEIQELEDYSYLKNQLFQKHTYILFTSRYSVKYLFKIAKECKAHITAKIVSIGKTTTKALLEEGICDIYQVEKDDSYGVIEWFSKQEKGSILFPRSSIALPIIPQGLKNLGFNVDCISVYKTVCPSNPQKVNLNNIQKIIFTSPSTIENFIKIYGALPENMIYETRGRITQEILTKLQTKNNTNVSL